MEVGKTEIIWTRPVDQTSRGPSLLELEKSTIFKWGERRRRKRGKPLTVFRKSERNHSNLGHNTPPGELSEIQERAPTVNFPLYRSIIRASRKHIVETWPSFPVKDRLRSPEGIYEVRCNPHENCDHSQFFRCPHLRHTCNLAAPLRGWSTNVAPSKASETAAWGLVPTNLSITGLRSSSISRIDCGMSRREEGYRED